MDTYTTIQGDTWDLIAYKTLNNELYADKVMQANPDLIDIFVFSAGTVVNIPVLDDDTEDTSDFPPWRY